TGTARIMSQTIARVSIGSPPLRASMRRSTAVAYEKPTSRYWPFDLNTWSTNADHAPVATSAAEHAMPTAANAPATIPTARTLVRQARPPATASVATTAANASRPMFGLLQNDAAVATPIHTSGATTRLPASEASRNHSRSRSATSAPSTAHAV